MGARKKKEEEDLIKKADAEKKALEAEAKKKAMEEAEIKRQEMLAAQKEKGGKSKEQVEEECRISLNIRLKPLQLDAMDSDELKAKAKRIWESIVTLETDKYDYEQRKLDQDYEMKELQERQKLQMRNKAIKKGLDPEAFCGAHPPRIHMFSKYERRTETRTQNGPREQRPDFQSGSEKDPAKRLEILRLPRERKVALKMLLKKRNMTKRRRSMTRKRRSKLKLHKSENIPYISLLPLMKVKIFVNQ